jgi:hypothetical protein
MGPAILCRQYDAPSATVLLPFLADEMETTHKTKPKINRFTTLRKASRGRSINLVGQSDAVVRSGGLGSLDAIDRIMHSTISRTST